MKAAHGRSASIHMGPIGLFTLVVVIAIATVAVLALAAGRASAWRAERQAHSLTALYANEYVGQAFVSNVDEMAGALDNAGVERQDILDRLSREADELAKRACADPELSTPVTYSDLDLDASAGTVRVSFASQSGRLLEVELSLDNACRPHISSWKASTRWEEDTSDTLWKGPSESTMADGRPNR